MLQTRSFGLQSAAGLIAAVFPIVSADAAQAAKAAKAAQAAKTAKTAETSRRRKCQQPKGRAVTPAALADVRTLTWSAKMLMATCRSPPH